MKKIEYDEATFPKKGDLVRIRTIAEMKKLYKDLYTIRYSSEGGFPNHYVKEKEDERVPYEFVPLFEINSRGQIEFYYMYFSFNKNDEMCASNKTGYITGTNRNKANVRINGGKEHGMLNWTFPIEFLEVVEPNYMGKKYSKMEEKKKMRIEATDYDGVVEEMISKVDKRKMKRILSSCLQIDAKQIVGIDALLKTWAEAKKDIYLLFDRQLSKSVDNEFELSYDEKTDIFKELEKKFPIEYYYFYNKFSFESEVFPNTIRKNSGYNQLKKIFPNIQEGMKFTQLVHEACKNEKLDTALSEFYNLTKVKGCITISIDPIEYMLMSLNDSGWSSCHTLHQQKEGRVSYGCYSAGIFSYMCDDASIIAFRHKKEESEIVVNRTKIKAFSKSWRQMVYLNLDEKSFICSRQYPSSNVVAEKVVRDMFEEMLSNKFELNNVWKIKRDKYDIQRHIIDEVPSDIDDYDKEEYVPVPLHYNDVLNGFNCTMVYNKQLNNINDVIIKIGSYPACPICGESILDDHERPVCYGCYEKYLD